MKNPTNNESEHSKALRERKDPLKKNRWLKYLNLIREEQQLVHLMQLSIEYNQKPFESLGDLFSYKELEATALDLIDNNLSRFPEIVSFDKDKTILVHPDIAIQYVELLASGGGWFIKKVVITK